MRGNLPNSLERNVLWKEQVEKRGEIRQKRVDKKGRSVGKKEVFEVGESVKLQNLKAKQWDTDGVIMNVRVSADGTICSYDLETNGTVTTRHRKYIMKVPTQANSADGTQDTTIDTSDRAYQVTESQRASVASITLVTNKSHRNPVSHDGLGSSH